MTALYPKGVDMSCKRNSRGGLTTLLMLGLLMALTAGTALADANGVERASWLLQRGNLETLALTGQTFAQSDIGSSGDDLYMPAETGGKGGGGQAGLKMLASLVLPGAGEALGGHKRGYVMMAVDIFSWTQVSKYHQDGEDYSDAYYEFADAHYTDANLVLAYNRNTVDPRAGLGLDYIPNAPTINDESELDGWVDGEGNEIPGLPLYVTKEDDRREYYENLGKWDQFIFGWDDFIRPDSPPPGIDYVSDGSISDLRQPWVSYNRETYRTMRADANDAYKTRDRWLYLNIGLRVFSVLQVAYLEGLLGGADNEMAVLGHPVQIIAQPSGPYKGTVAATVAF